MSTRVTSDDSLDREPGRVSAAEVEERRRLELDLHEGAQERLVLAALTLRRAASHVDGTSAEQLVAEASQQLQEGLAALRDLGRAIHPYALSRYGLATALEGLAARAPVPIDLRVTPDRLQPVVEAAIYSTVSEALADIARNVETTRATVTVTRTGDDVVAEVVGDGDGGKRIRAVVPETMSVGRNGADTRREERSMSR
jgi:signal transduction histidine kinase